MKSNDKPGAVPVRVQRSRKKGSKLSEAATKGLPIKRVTRPSKWGTPFEKRKGEKSQQRMVEAFENSLDAATIAAARSELRGKNLACWCPLDEPLCHADVLLRVANEPDT